MKHSYIFTLLTCLLFSMTSQAQDWLGLGQMNHAGVNSLEINPANIADSRLKVDIMLAGFTLGAYNNYASVSRESLTDTARLNDPNFIDNYMMWDDNGEDKSIYFNNRVYLPSFMLSINEKMGVGFTWQIRSMINIDGVSQDLATLVREQLEYPSLWVTDLENRALSVQFNSWAEYGFNFGMVVMDQKEHFLKVGGRLKILQGLGSAYTFVDDLNYNFTNADTLSLFQSQVDYGHSSNFEFDEDDPAGSFSYRFVSNPGLGLDLGAVYEWRPDWQDYKYDMDGETDLWRKDQNKYKLKVGLSILDMGRIRYDKGQFSNSFIADIQGLPIDTVSAQVTNVTSWDQFLDTFQVANDSREYFMTLPTSVSLQVDYHIWKDFYVNFTPYWALQMRNNRNKTHFYSNYSLTPRWDHKWFGVAIPMSYSNFAGTRVGLGLRLGPLMLGTSNLGGLSKTSPIQGADLWVGLKVPIHHRHPKDRDEDKVSDKMDQCIDIPGTWDFKGCPDTDGDGIVDTEDACPAEAGLIEFNGCPDTDGDKIVDKDDECPTVPGLEQFKGCPDTDEDGIQDSEDDCPEVAGIAEFKGCPDTDGDGLKDSDDLCPETPGPIENDGCPDTDGDGIFDYLDECPTEPGPGENRGCPWPDTDGDGLLDKDDKCPNNPGPVENEGCPYTDTDGDGVLDKDDQCPNVVGIPENFGCPEIKEEEQEIINTAFENLEFESGKDVIRNSSFPSLVELAELLKKKPEWKLRIAGHTDNVGSERNNLVLSKKRAEAVKNFLTDNGVNPENIIVEYYGETQPIADNETQEGRQKNRRVEMTIVFE